MNVTHLLFPAAQIVLFLVCGVFGGLYFALSRSYHLFRPAELAKIARIIVANLEVPMRNFSILCLVLLGWCIALSPAKNCWQFYALIASLVMLAGALVITTAIEVPINRQVVTWTDDDAPSNWQELRDRWQYYNIVRTILAVTSFALFTFAI
jgi:uncharacterized membrane protein